MSIGVIPQVPQWSEWVRDGQMTPAGHQALAFLFQRANEIKAGVEASQADLVELANRTNALPIAIRKTSAPVVLAATTSGITTETSVITATFQTLSASSVVEVYGELQYSSGTITPDDDGLSITLNAGGAASGADTVTAAIAEDATISKSFVFRYAPGLAQELEYDLRVSATAATTIIKGSWMAFREIAG